MPPTPQSIIDDRRSSQRKAALACGQEEIFTAMQSQEITLWRATKVFTYPPDSKDPSFLVKYSKDYTRWLLESEMRNQKFAFDALRERGPQQFPGLLVCVPEIFKDFEYRGYYFLVMEFVPGRTLVEVGKEERNALAAAAAGAGAGDRAESQLVKRLYRCVAEGIRLLSVKAPPGTKPGPVGGGRIRHPFFKDSESRIPYRDMKMLETHLNKVLRMRTRGDPNPPTISLDRELEFYYADLYGGNFIFTNVANHTVLYILDFDEAGFLPHSFMSFMLHSDIRPIITAGPSYNLDDHTEVPVNSPNPVKVSTEHMDVDLNVRIQNYKGLPVKSPSTSPYFDQEPHNTNKDHYAMKIVKWWIDPGIDGDPYADSPYLFGPALSSFNHIQVGPGTFDESKGGLWIEEGASPDGDAKEWRAGVGAPDDSKARMKWALRDDSKEKWVWEYGRTYAADFFNAYLDFSEFALRLPGYAVPIMKYWDGQGLRYVLRNRTTKQVYLVVLFTLYLREDVNEDGTLKPEAARAYTTHAPAAMEEQAAIANEEDAKEPDFDGEAALEKARKHLSDVELAKQDAGATNEPDDID
ncbi:hypothetical protein VSDG_05148 [Cytospora chrysosperma]|uniref:Uncharacterized protein n=1 Tax=Cytospora chrysosperma TaxID=252740 RepID=A0A423VXV0_CYTCH|nr:hypothetical protein VSDG_05148 [Valsa sordida]